MKTVNAPRFLAHLAAGETVFDTRSPALIAQDGLKGVEHLNLEALSNGTVPDLPRDTPLYLLCERGAASELAGLYLENAGFSEVYNVLGGMKAVREAMKDESTGTRSQEPE